MKRLFDDNNRYTEYGLDLAQEIQPLVIAQIYALIKEQGYTMRTVMGPASSPAVSAETYDVCPKEFHALWIGEVSDVCLDRILDQETIT